MHLTNINEAKTHLSSLIKRALAGEDVIIARANEPLVRLTPIAQDVRPRMGGQWVGQIVMGDNFEFTAKELDELFHRPVDPAGE